MARHETHKREELLQKNKTNSMIRTKQETDYIKNKAAYIKSIIRQRGVETTKNYRHNESLYKIC